MAPLLFFDPLCPRPYGEESLRAGGRAGTEASTVRIAQALDAWVAQHNRTEAEGLGETIERIALQAVDHVACELGVSREELVLALRSEEAFDRFTAENGIERARAEDAIHDGLVQAVDEAEGDGTLPGLIAPLVRGAAESVPPWLLLETLDALATRFGVARMQVDSMRAGNER